MFKTALNSWCKANLHGADHLTRAKKIVAIAIATFSSVALVANYALFLHRYDDIRFYDHLIMFYVPILVVGSAIKLCMEAQEIDKTAAWLFGASYFLVVVNSIHNGTVVGTVAFFFLALAICFVMFYGWTGFAVAAAVSVAHFALFTNPVEFLPTSFTLLNRDGAVPMPEDVNGVIQDYGLVFFACSACAAVFNDQMKQAVAALAAARQNAAAPAQSAEIADPAPAVS